MLFKNIASCPGFEPEPKGLIAQTGPQYIRFSFSFEFFIFFDLKGTF